MFYDRRDGIGMTAEPYTGPIGLSLYDLLVELDETAAAVWQDGSPWQAGVREGLERAAVLVRERLAHAIQDDR
jgi:hypothetical protein